MFILYIISQIQATFYIKHNTKNMYVGFSRVKEDLKMVDTINQAQKVKILFFAPTNYFKIEKLGLSRSYLTKHDNKLQFSRENMGKTITNDVEKDVSGNNQVFELIDTTPVARIVAIKHNNLCLAEKDDMLQLEECDDSYANQLFELIPANDIGSPTDENEDYERKRPGKLFIPDNFEASPEYLHPNKLFYPATHLKEIEKDADTKDKDLERDVTRDLRSKEKGKPEYEKDQPKTNLDLDIKRLLQDLRAYLVSPGVNDYIRRPNELDTKTKESDILERRRPVLENKLEMNKPHDDDRQHLPSQKSDDIDKFSDAFGNYMQQFGDDMCKLVFNIGLKFLRYAKDRLQAKKLNSVDINDMQPKKDNTNRDLFFGDTVLQTINDKPKND